MQKSLNLGAFLRENMRAYKDRTALVCGEKRFSYADLLAQAEDGTEENDTFCVAKGERLEQARAILGGLLRGRVVVPIFEEYGEAYCRSILDALGEADCAQMPEDVALVLFTSGSTGKPKGVMLSHENVISNLRAIRSYFGVREGDRILIARPLMHAAVLVGEFLFGLCQGAEIHLHDEPFMPARVAAAIEKKNVSALGCTPTLWEFLMPHLKNRETALRVLSLSGEILRAELALETAKRFPALQAYSVYGLTECSPRVSACLPRDFARKAGSVGKPIAGVEMKLKEERPCETEDGVCGRLAVRSRGVMRGYLGNEALTKTKIVDGWLDTGDVARRDSEGYYYILGRADDMIVRCGVNVYPAEMESLLKADPAVRDASFFVREGRLCVQIVGDMVREEARKICLRRLPSFAVPQCVEVVSELARTPSGKRIRGSGL